MVTDAKREAVHRKIDIFLRLIIEVREGFRRMDERFLQIDKRFEQVDKRFETIQAEMNRRFEQVDA